MFKNILVSVGCGNDVAGGSMTCMATACMRKPEGNYQRPLFSYLANPGDQTQAEPCLRTIFCIFLLNRSALINIMPDYRFILDIAIFLTSPAGCSHNADLRSINIKQNKTKQRQSGSDSSPFPRELLVSVFCSY